MRGFNVSDIVIRVDKVSKAYKIYNKPIERIKEAIHPRRKIYHKLFFALQNIDFKVSKGEVIGIIGRNGSGKSTLLKILTGVVTPSEGNIEIQGKISALLELGAGFNPELNGIENIYFYGTIQGCSRQQIEEKLDEIIAFADIGEHIYQPVKSYSSGMFARLAFSVAVHVNPDILIVDEALAVGDIRFQQKAMRKMKELMESAKAILFVSHDMRSIRNFCSRVLWLMDGKIYQDGDPKTIVRMYEDYMIHGILPNQPQESNCIMKIDREENDNPVNVGNGLVWQEIKASSELGGDRAFFNRIAFDLPKGVTTESLNGNEKLVVYVQLVVKETILSPLFGFGVFNDKGLAIIHFNSDTANASLCILQEKTMVHVCYQLQLPDLRDGNYFLSLGLDDGKVGDSEVIHHATDCVCLKVHRQDKFARQYGTIIVPNAQIECIEPERTLTYSGGQNE